MDIQGWMLHGFISISSAEIKLYLNYRMHRQPHVQSTSAEIIAGSKAQILRCWLRCKPTSNKHLFPLLSFHSPVPFWWVWSYRRRETPQLQISKGMLSMINSFLPYHIFSFCSWGKKLISFLLSAHTTHIYYAQAFWAGSTTLVSVSPADTDPGMNSSFWQLWNLEVTLFYPCNEIGKVPSGTQRSYLRFGFQALQSRRVPVTLVG